jgi:hypothetical protein
MWKVIDAFGWYEQGFYDDPVEPVEKCPDA